MSLFRKEFIMGNSTWIPTPSRITKLIDDIENGYNKQLKAECHIVKKNTCPEKAGFSTL